MEIINNKIIRVLIIDDDRLIRAAVRNILERYDINYRVDEAADADSLMEKLKVASYKCILLDYFLKDTNGLEILENLKKMKITIPVILITGLGDEMLAVKAMKTGAYDYLPKSILTHEKSGEILNYTIRNAIDVYNLNLDRKRTANALQKSEERYRSLVENSPILILRFFPDDRVISFANDGLCAYYNSSRSDIIGDSLMNFIPKDGYNKADKLINSLNKEHPVISFERYETTNGIMRWQLWTLQALFDKGDNILEYQCIGEDITSLKLAEKEIYNQKMYLQSILDSQENMIFVTNRKGIILANRSFLEFFGYSTLDEFNKKCADISELAVEREGCLSKSESVQWIDTVLNNSDKQNLMAFMPLENKTPRIFSVSLSKLAGDGEGYVAAFSDVTRLEEKSKAFEKKSEIDALTGIFNKNKFNEMLSCNVEIAGRYGSDLSIIFFDIDNFKKINDTFGHQVGDYVLKELANTVKKTVRKSDVFARWGGEEFMLLLPQIDFNNAAKAAEKFRLRVNEKYFDDVQYITCSFGVTGLTKKDTPESFIERADRALYKAKKSGKNRVVGIRLK